MGGAIQSNILQCFYVANEQMIENVFNLIASVSRCSRCIKENVVTPEVDIVSHDHFHGRIHLYVMYVQRSMAGLSQAAGK